MKGDLKVGAAEIDITPPVGTMLVGALKPRPSTGIQDPLTAKAIVLESGNKKLCYVLLDLLFLPRQYGDKAVEIASQKTGIPESAIVWAASHTHTGPYTTALIGDPAQAINREWLEGLPLKIAEAVEQAAKTTRPAKMSRSRAYCNSLSHNRRIKFKDGREINDWLLDHGEEETQSLGTAGPIDPEIGILCFDDENDVPIAVLWNFALHTNSNFGPCFSADYPAVVASRLIERFGRQTITLFMPGTCGDLNPHSSYREVGDILADSIITRLNQRVTTDDTSIKLGSLKRDLIVPWRDPDAQSDERIERSQWHEGSKQLFREEIEYMKKQPEKYDNTVIQAWRIGNIGFASLPGEAFLGLGLAIKERSPFPWTYPVELGGDYLGYLVTEQAWKGGGYESLVARLARPSVEGVNAMVNTAVEMLHELWQAK